MKADTKVHVKVLENRCVLRPDELSRRARMALLALLNDYYGIKTLPQMSCAFGGKPYFPDYPAIHFSLSHCKAAVMAVVGGTPVGCDIEDIVDDGDVADLADVAFNAQERSFIYGSPTPALELTRIWTCKEAVVKCIGFVPDDPCDWPSVAPNMVTDSMPDYVFTYCWL